MLGLAHALPHRVAYIRIAVQLLEHASEISIDHDRLHETCAKWQRYIYAEHVNKYDLVYNYSSNAR